MTPFLNLMRAEYLEHKVAMWLPPVFVAVLVIGLALMFGLPNSRIETNFDFDSVASSAPADSTHAMPEKSDISNRSISSPVLLSIISGAALPVLLITLASSYFILASSLHGERADRSILFWKSLPVSDQKTVLAKFASSIFIPVGIGVAVGALVIVVYALIGASFALRMNLPGVSDALGVGTIISGVANLVLIAAIYLIWAAPIYAWFAFASAIAPRTPLIVAILPPIIIGYVEGLFFRTSWFGSIFTERMFGGYLAPAFQDPIALQPQGGTASSSIRLLTDVLSVNSLLGLVVAAALLFAAAEYRRRRAL